MNTNRSYIRGIITISLLLAATAVPGAPVGVADAKEPPATDTAAAWCEVTGPGEQTCSFICVPGIILVELAGDGDGSVEAECGSSQVAHCSGAPCSGTGVNTNTATDGTCTAKGDGWTKASCGPLPAVENYLDAAIGTG